MSDNEETMEPVVKKLRLENDQFTTSVKPDDIVVGDLDDQDLTISNDKYNFVNSEELEKLKEFKVLDEVRSNDEDSNDDDSDSSEDKSEGLPEEELEKMLDEDLPEDFKGAPKIKEKLYITKQKIVLEEKGINHFEVLPLDWMMARHYSGMPIYIHRTTRVCTLSKPYFLGKGNTKRHDIPISAIPCLAYRKALEEEQKQKEIDKQIQEQIKNGMWQQNVYNSEPNEDIEEKTDSIDVQNELIEGDNSINSFCEDVKCPLTGLVNETSEITKLSKENIFKCPFLKQQRGSNTVEIVTSLNNVVDNTKLNESITNSENELGFQRCEVDSQDGYLGTTALTNDTKVDSAGDAASGISEEVPLSGITEEIPLGTTEDIPLIAANYATEEIPFNAASGTTEEIPLTTAIPLNRQPVVLPGGIVMPPPRVETVSTSWKSQHLSHDQLNQYCRSLFRFRTIEVMHFKRWADRRKYLKARKTLQYPTLPEGTKLITIPAQPTPGQENGGKPSKRDWVMNMNGRSYLSVFHEYVRRALQKQPVYEFKQLENASTPYQATVYIGGMQYGVGHGSSKRSAKSQAARASIHILIPEMRAELDRHKPHPAEPDFTFFDYVGIEDPRITEFCAATCEPSPHAILRTCLLRNFGAQDKHIHTEMKKLEYQKIELTMKVGKHTATVVCKNKKTAKQRASQSILQALHPHVRSWGSLLRLYGSRSVKSCKEKKLEEQQITLLQDAAKHNEPNYAVLDKLRHEMKKLKQRDEAVVPIGTLLVKDDLPTHSGSNLNNVEL